MSEWSLAAPDALRALYALAQALPGDPAPTAHFGPAVEDTEALEAVIIGYSDEKIEAVEHDFDEGDYTPNSLDQFRINNQILVLNGGGEDDDSLVTALITAVDRAYEILRDLGRAIAEDPSLGGVVMEAGISHAAYHPLQSSHGPIAAIDVTVRCQAYTGA